MGIGRENHGKYMPHPIRHRVRIGFEGRQGRTELPFVMGVLADLSGVPGGDDEEPLENRRMFDVDVFTFDEALLSVKPRVTFGVPNRLTEEGLLPIDLTFKCMDDFSPGRIAANVSGLSEFLQIRIELAHLTELLLTRKDVAAFVAELLAGERSAESSLSEGAEPLSQGTRAVLHQARAEGRLGPGREGQTIQAIIAELDQKLTEQVNLILHHDEFQQLESTWRGLHYLASNTETSLALRIRVLNISKKELSEIFASFSGVQWHRSPLFKKLYEIPVAIHPPFGCIVGDYEFSHHPKDVKVLSGMATIAAAAHAPFIAGVSPSLLGLDSWQELSPEIAFEELFAQPQYAPWRSLRQSEDSQYLCLTMPRFLARLPYGAKTRGVEEFAFEEECDGRDPENYVWANAAYAMAEIINEAVHDDGWAVRIQGTQGGGRLSYLPLYVSERGKSGDIDPLYTAPQVSPRLAARLNEVGLAALVLRPEAREGEFPSARSLNRPPRFRDPEDTKNARLMATLPYVFASSLFVHYLRAIAIDSVGPFRDADQLKQLLNEWISQYVEPNPKAPEAVRARRPLRVGEVEVREEPGASGSYMATLTIQPHYQLEDLTAPFSVRFVLPA